MESARNSSSFHEQATIVDSDGVGIRVACFGPQDGEPVVLLHGFPDSAQLWWHQVGPLASAGYRVLALDQRGCGGSGKPTDVAAYSMGTLVGDVCAVLDAHDFNRAHVVGHDWGAAVGWAMAIFSPERMTSFTALSVGHPEKFTQGGLEQRQRSWYMLAFQFPGLTEDWLARDDWAAARELLATHPDVESVVAAMSEPGALTAALNCYRANVSPEMLLGPPLGLPAVDVDVMGVWSSGDIYLSESRLLDSAELVNGEWRYERIEGASHWLQVDAADRVNELLLEWLGRQ